MHTEFEVHMLNNGGKARAITIATMFDNLVHELSACIPEGHYMSIVRTKLEEACFFAKIRFIN